MQICSIRFHLEPSSQLASDWHAVSAIAGPRDCRIRLFLGAGRGGRSILGRCTSLESCSPTRRPVVCTLLGVDGRRASSAHAVGTARPSSSRLGCCGVVGRVLAARVRDASGRQPVSWARSSRGCQCAWPDPISRLLGPSSKRGGVRGLVERSLHSESRAAGDELSRRHAPGSDQALRPRSWLSTRPRLRRWMILCEGPPPPLVRAPRGVMLPARP